MCLIFVGSVGRRGRGEGTAEDEGDRVRRWPNRLEANDGPLFGGVCSHPH